MTKTFITLASVVLTIVSAHAGQQNVARSSKISRAANKDKAVGRECPADKITIDGRDVQVILDLLGAERDPGATDKELLAYAKHFDRQDADRDGKHSKKEYVENGVHMNPQARRGIFGAADNNADGYVTRIEYILNRIITDEAKDIIQRTDTDKNGKIIKTEFVNGSPLKDKPLVSAVFDALDSNDDGTITIPEYLRVWGVWARPNYKKQETAIHTRLEKLTKDDSGVHTKASAVTATTASAPAKKGEDKADLKRLWSYGLTSRRTGEPLIEEGGEHKIDKSKVSYGYNIVVD